MLGKRLKNRLKSKKGFSLPVAIAITVVVIILSASLIAIAGSSIVNTSKSISGRQAYLNVRSALEYARAYYTDQSNVQFLSTVKDQYMVMNDVEGGTIANGGTILSKTGSEAAAEAEGYSTYVIANYVTADTVTATEGEEGAFNSSNDQGALVLRAVSKTTDAFGNVSDSVSVNAIYTVTIKHNTVLPIWDIDTKVEKKVDNRDVINMHLKRYPGINWLPFYYVWTYKDVADMYSQTDNCYGLETAYKNAVAAEDNPDNGKYWKSDRTQGKVIAGMNQNEYKDNSVKPAGVWNVVKDADGVERSAKNGTTSFFSPTGSSGWCDATYYIDSECVNYFNLIICKKGSSLSREINNKDSQGRVVGVQSCEMFHLWFLNRKDKNLYFEMLQPELYYVVGQNWNGRTQLDNNFLVYVKNQKTAVHFKVKGIGDTKDQALTKPTKNPVINEIRVGGVSIFESNNTYNEFKKSFSTNYYNTRNLEKNFTNAFYGQTDMQNYFYNIVEDGQKKMLYEGCGWWVANVTTGESFVMNITFYDTLGNEYTDLVRVSPSSSDDAWVVADISGSNSANWSVNSYYTETKALSELKINPDSYVTVNYCSSERGSPVSPYLDYKTQFVSSEARRNLHDTIITAQKYNRDNYTETSYDALSAEVANAITLYNNDGYILEKGLAIAEQDYKNEISTLKNLIANLRPRELDDETKQAFDELVAKADEMKKKQETDFIYDRTKYGVFIADDGNYNRAKSVQDHLRESYNATSTYELMDALREDMVILDASQVNREDLLIKYEEAKLVVKDNKYEEEFRSALNNIVATVTGGVRDDEGTLIREPSIGHITSQEDIDYYTNQLTAGITETKNHPVTQFDTSDLTDAILEARTLLTKTKTDCTDNTYDNLSAKLTAAENRLDNLTSEAEIEADTRALQTAIENFTVKKPGGSGVAASMSEDALIASGKKRVWLYGFDRVNTIPGYTRIEEDGSSSFVSYKYNVTGCAIELYYKGADAGILVSSNKVFDVPSQNLSYFDINLNSGDGVRLYLTLKHANYSPDGSTVLSYTTETFSMEGSPESIVGDCPVIVFEGLEKRMGRNNVGEETSTNILKVSNTELAQIFVESESNDTGAYVIYPQSEKYPSGAVIPFNPSREGDYSVYRYPEYNQQRIENVGGTDKYVDVTDENGDPVHSTVQLRALQTETRADGTEVKQNLYSSLNTVMNQRVVRFTGTLKKGKTVTLFIPAAFPEGIPYSDAGNVRVIAGGTEYPVLLMGGYYVSTIPGTVTGEAQVIRSVRDSSGNVTEITGNSIPLGSSGLQKGRDYRIVYSTGVADYSVSYFADNYDTVPSLVDVSKIYPKYLEGGSSSGSSAGAVSGMNMLIDSFALNLAIPTLSSSVTTSTTFDFHGLSGTNNEPSKNIGLTVIWIDKEVYDEYIYQEGAPDIYPRVYVESYSKTALNGAYPGNPALQVANTHYFYVVVPSTYSSASAYYCTISGYKKVSNKYRIKELPIGFDNGGRYSQKRYRIYFDNTDKKGTTGEYVNYRQRNPDRSYRVEESVVDVAMCAVPEQGRTCLYEVIDKSVVDGTYKFTIGGYGNNGSSIEPGEYHPELPSDDRENTYFLDAFDPSVGTPACQAIPGSGTGSYRRYYYYYRAKGQDLPPRYEYDMEEIDVSSWQGQNLRLAFVGGNKIRLQNYSYFFSYGTMNTQRKSVHVTSRQNSNHDQKLTSTEQYGGKGGNQNSDGRIGDTSLSVVYDWYERKIPVDATELYDFQLHGLKVDQECRDRYSTQKWYDDDYYTDDKVYTTLIPNVYGSLYLRALDVTKMGTGTNATRLINLELSSRDIETIQVKENVTIFLKIPSEWGSVSNLKVYSNGVGGTETANFTPFTGDTNGFYCATVKGNHPFLTIECIRGDGSPYSVRTVLQGDDDVLFKPNATLSSGTWSSYVTPDELLSRELYVIQSQYFGNVIAKEYTDKCIVKSQGSSSSYNYAEALYHVFLKRIFIDGSGKESANLDLGKAKNLGLDYAYVRRWTAAYANLYKQILAARENIPNRNYPEYKNNPNKGLYTSESVANLRKVHDECVTTYLSSTDWSNKDTLLAKIEKAGKDLDNAINGLKISSTGKLHIVFYDIYGLYANGNEVKLVYKTREGGPDVKTTFESTTVKDDLPIVHLDYKHIYDVRLEIAGVERAERIPEAKITDEVWVYFDSPYSPTWEKKPTVDMYEYRYPTLYQSDVATATYYMNVLQDDPDNLIPYATTLEAAKALTYKNVSLSFSTNTEVKFNNGTEEVTYTIPAKRYYFTSSTLGRTSNPFKFEKVSKTTVSGYTSEYIYFVDTTGRSEPPYVYFFKNGGTTVGAGWPGTKMEDMGTGLASEVGFNTDYNGYHCYKMLKPSGADMLIFNTGYHGMQTADLPISGSGETGYYLNNGNWGSIGKFFPKSSSVTTYEYIPVLDLYSVEAKNYFTSDDVAGYYRPGVRTWDTSADNPVASWVNGEHKSTIKTGAFSYTGSGGVNMMVDSGNFVGISSSYSVKNKGFFFGWNNDTEPLKVSDNVRITAPEITLKFARGSDPDAVSIDASSRSNTHFYLSNSTIPNQITEMYVNFLTDIVIKIKTKDRNNKDTIKTFTIPAGKYLIRRPEKSKTNYIADLFDPDYWADRSLATPQSEDNKSDNGNGSSNRLSSPVFSD